ncbi:MAG: hypothetical protein AAGD06_32175 [Acidobacteriota bacterium]
MVHPDGTPLLARFFGEADVVRVKWLGSRFTSPFTFKREVFACCKVGESRTRVDFASLTADRDVVPVEEGLGFLFQPPKFKRGDVFVSVDLSRLPPDGVSAVRPMGSSHTGAPHVVLPNGIPTSAIALVAWIPVQGYLAGLIGTPDGDACVLEATAFTMIEDAQAFLRARGDETVPFGLVVTRRGEDDSGSVRVPVRAALVPGNKYALPAPLVDLAQFTAVTCEANSRVPEVFASGSASQKAEVIERGYSVHSSRVTLSSPLRLSTMEHTGRTAKYREDQWRPVERSIVLSPSMLVLRAVSGDPAFPFPALAASINIGRLRPEGGRSNFVHIAPHAGFLPRQRPGPRVVDALRANADDPRRRLALEEILAENQVFVTVPCRGCGQLVPPGICPHCRAHLSPQYTALCVVRSAMLNSALAAEAAYQKATEGIRHDVLEAIDAMLRSSPGVTLQDARELIDDELVTSSKRRRFQVGAAAAVGVAQAVVGEAAGAVAAACVSSIASSSRATPLPQALPPPEDLQHALSEAFPAAPAPAQSLLEAPGGTVDLAAIYREVQAAHQLSGEQAERSPFPPPAEVPDLVSAVLNLRRPIALRSYLRAIKSPGDADAAAMCFAGAGQTRIRDAKRIGRAVRNAGGPEGSVIALFRRNPMEVFRHRISGHPIRALLEAAGAVQLGEAIPEDISRVVVGDDLVNVPAVQFAMRVAVARACITYAVTTGERSLLIDRATL